MNIKKKEKENDEKEQPILNYKSCNDYLIVSKQQMNDTL